MHHLQQTLGKLRFSLAALVVLFLSAPSFATDERKLKFEYAFEIDGEPAAISIQDQQGFLWFTSFFNGIVQFDGSEVKHFRVGSDFISSDYATQIFEDSEGVLWIGTSNGLNRSKRMTTNGGLRPLVSAIGRVG